MIVSGLVRRRNRGKSESIGKHRCRRADLGPVAQVVAVEAVVPGGDVVTGLLLCCGTMQHMEQ